MHFSPLSLLYSSPPLRGDLHLLSPGRSSEEPRTQELEIVSAGQSSLAASATNAWALNSWWNFAGLMVSLFWMAVQPLGWSFLLAS